MNHMSLMRWLPALLVWGSLAAGVHADWDAHIRHVVPPPSVQVYPASQVASSGVKLVSDDQAIAGQAAVLTPGGGALSFERSLPAGRYVLYVVTRMERDNERLPAPPIVLHLRVTSLPGDDTDEAASGSDSAHLSQDSRTRVAAYERYQDTGHLYFDVHKPGTYRVEVFSSPRSHQPVFVDRLDLKDVLGNLPDPSAGVKQGQYLLTPDELQALRRLPASVQEAQTLTAAQELAGLSQMTDEQLADWRKTTFDVMWEIVPPANLHFENSRLSSYFLQWIGDEAYNHDGARQWAFTLGLKPRQFEKRAFILPADVSEASLNRLNVGPWGFTHPRKEAIYRLEDWLAGRLADDCAVPDDGTGFYLEARKVGGPIPLQVNWLASELMQNYQGLRHLAIARGGAYERTANELAGWEGACALLAYVYRYPQLDYQTQRFDFGPDPFGQGTRVNYNPYGKIGGSGGEWQIESLIRAYDQLFPIIQGNQALADFMARQIPSLRTPEDVVRFLDRNLLQHVRDAAARQVIRGVDAAVERTLSAAALVQGPGEAGRWMWEPVFTQAAMRMDYRGGLQDHLVSSVTADGGMYQGTLVRVIDQANTLAGVLDRARRYLALGGQLPVDLTDVIRYPSVNLTAEMATDMLVAGGFMPRIGRSGAPDDAMDDRNRTIPKAAKPMFLTTWLQTGDPRIAWSIRHMGRTDESDALWQRIDASASHELLDPLLTARTRQLPGQGLTILEAHPHQSDFRLKHALVMRTGAAAFSAHSDRLGLTYIAQGVRLIADTGRQGDQPDGAASRLHHLVEVDGRDMTNESGQGGIGWTEALADLHDVGYSSASAWASSHPALKTYRRQVALVPVGEDAYAVDLFRIEGGQVHTWTSPGPVASDASQVSFNTTMSDRVTDLLRQYPGPGYDALTQGVAPPMLQITWQAAPEMVRRAQRVARNQTPPPVSLRAWLPGVEGLPVIHAYGGVSDPKGRKYPFNFVHVRRQDEGKPLSDTFLAVLEGYAQDRPIVSDVREVELPGLKTAHLARALRVLTHTGRQDTIYTTDTRDAYRLPAATLPDGVTLSGQFAIASRQGNQVVHLAGVNAVKLSAGDVTLEPAHRQYEAVITAMDVTGNTLTLDKPLWPAGFDTPAASQDQDDQNAHARMSAGALPGLPGGVMVWRRGKPHQLSLKLRGVSGNQLALKQSLAVYQSHVTHFEQDRDDDGNAGSFVVPELPPPLVELEPHYYDGLALVNEQGSIVGRARVQPGDRMMYLGYPEHWQWSQKLQQADLAKGDDGRLRFKLIAADRALRVRGVLPDGKADTYPVPAGQTLAELEITRVSEDGLSIWFKDPPQQYADDNHLPSDTWAYAGHWLQTPAGRRIVANIPGTQWVVRNMDKPLSQGDFPDVDHDGRPMVYITHAAPGDTVVAPAWISAHRVHATRWEVRANTPATMTLAGQTITLEAQPALMEPGVAVVRRGGQWRVQPIETDAPTP